MFLFWQQWPVHGLSKSLRWNQRLLIGIFLLQWAEVVSGILWHTLENKPIQPRWSPWTKEKQRNKETNKTNKWTKNIFTNFDKMLLVKFILHPDFMALSLEFIACHAFSIAHPQCSKQAQYKKYFSLDKQHIYWKKIVVIFNFLPRDLEKSTQGGPSVAHFWWEAGLCKAFLMHFLSWVRQ